MTPLGTRIFVIALLAGFSPTQSQSFPAYGGSRKFNKASHAQLKNELAEIQSASESFQAPMRAFMFWQVGQVVKARIGESESVRLYRRAFEATSAEDFPTGQASNLQPFIFDSLLQTKEGQTFTTVVLQQANPSARASIATIAVKHAIARKDFAAAKAIIRTTASLGEYPYEAVEQLIAYSGSDFEIEKRDLFFEALSAFAASGPHSISSQPDLTSILKNTWKVLPRDLVLEAIKVLLSDAEKRDSKQITSIPVSAPQGSFTFANAYQYRVFQVIEILREIDERQAKRLLEENPAVARALAQIPTSAMIQDPVLNSDSAQNDSGGAQNLELANFAEQIEARESEIIRKAKEDPKGAFARTAELPIMHPQVPEVSPRGDALDAIARLSVEHDPSTAKASLKQLKQLAGEMPPWAYAHNVVEIAETYQKLGDDAGALGAINDALPVVKKLYAIDTDRDDPNLAPKQNWPSTFVWSQLAACAEKIDPTNATSILDAIPDREISALIRLRQIANREKVPLSGFAIEVLHATKTRKGS